MVDITELDTYPGTEFAKQLIEEFDLGQKWINYSTRYIQSINDEKLSQKQQQKTETPLNVPANDGSIEVDKKERIAGGAISYSFSGSLRYPMRRSCVSSCPSSMRSSSSHSGIFGRNGGTMTPPAMIATSSSSSMEELQSAIQGAIAHCKNSMSQISKSNDI